ncbi:cytochrome P450 [Streptomyces sp. NPDC057798]|uniref:cytochrome P450 n=1 Tax=Streptomyces sp. NPDC057798 TaxID=3346252 RepID=UPI003675CE1C
MHDFPADATVRPWHEIPHRPGWRGPWLGQTAAFGRDPIGFLAEGVELVGPLYRFTLLGTPVVFACGPEAHREVLKAPDQTLSVGAAYPFMKPIFGPGVAYDAPPQEFRTQAGYLARHMSPVRVDAKVPMMARTAHEALEAWGEHGEVELLPALSEVVGAMVARALFGDELHRLIGPELIQLYSELAGGIQLAGMLSPRLPLPVFRRRDQARRRLAELMTQALAERRAVPRPGASDCLASLLEARNPDGRPLPDETIVGLLITMGFAALHTSASLASWTGVVLLEQSGLLSQVLDEQRAALADAEELNAAALDRMQLLAYCVREAERLYPPASILMRKAVSDFTLLGHHVPAGTLVLLAPAVSHRRPEVFNEPNRCDPLRYGAGREEHRQPDSLISFGGGHHGCIGQGLAQREMQTLWSVLLDRFDLKLLGGPHRPERLTAFVSRPSAPCVLRYRMRTVPGAGR